MEEGRPLRLEEGRQQGLAINFQISHVPIKVVFFSSIFPRPSSVVFGFQPLFASFRIPHL
jgi:hypothetical protein